MGNVYDQSGNEYHAYEEGYAEGFSAARTVCRQLAAALADAKQVIEGAGIYTPRVIRAIDAALNAAKEVNA